MKLARILLLFIILFNVANGSEIPDFRLRDFNRKLVTFNSVKGEQLTLVDFWATWCKPCLRAIGKTVAAGSRRPVSPGRYEHGS